MSLFHLFLLAVIQGITEFLPVSSSGHLILLPGLTGLADQGLALDVAVHVGTLAAVIAYFHKDVGLALAGTLQLLRGRVDTPAARLALHLAIATVPVILAGALLHLSGLSDALRSVAVIGWTMLVFGIVLYVADMRGPTHRETEDWSLRDAIWMGLAQAIALIPGTSRSGITITAGRALGFSREAAARISMLMSIPTILASGALLSIDVMRDPGGTLLREAAIGAGFAFCAAFLALTLMMRLLRSVSFTPYVIYRVILGLILLAVAYR